MTDELYVPAPLDTSTAALPEGLLKLTEYLAENAHENWAVQRISEGWKFGPKRDDANKLLYVYVSRVHPRKTLGNSICLMQL